MVRYSHAFKTGLFVCLLGTALVAGAIWLGDWGTVTTRYVVATEQAVSGLNIESTVYYRGVSIGKVTSIDFDRQNPRTILVGVNVQPDAPINVDTYATLRIAPLTGIATVELSNGQHPSPRLETSRERPGRIPMRPSTMEKLLDRGEDMAAEAGELFIRLNKLFSPESRDKLQHLLGRADEAMERFIALENKLDRSLTDLPAAVADARTTLTGLPAAVADARATLAEIRTTLEAARASLAGFRAATGSIKRGAAGFTNITLPQVQSLLQELQQTTGQVRETTEQLERRPQSLLFGPSAGPPGPGEKGYREPRR
jgi:phospholipid/cholesterol/gamma-HCH transport system substrate-binding protein